MSSKRRLSLRSESGIAALMVTMVLMIVISLIVIGFAQISRRQERETLDQQLNTQAFYAAESGINEAQKVINSALTAGTIVPEKNTCGDPGGSSPYHDAAANSTIDSAHDVSYTCLLVSTKVTSLTKSLDADTSWIVPLNTTDASGSHVIPSALRFSWPSDGTGNGLGQCPHTGDSTTPIQNLTTTDYVRCPYGVLRLDLVPIPQGTLSASAYRDYLLKNDLVTFFYPTPGNPSGHITYSAGLGHGNQIAANCDPNPSVATCSGIVDLDNATVQNAKQLYARVTMLYKGTGSNSIVIDANDDGSTYFTGTQAQIDSTGKAQDVLRRIRESVSISQDNSTVPFSPAITSRDSICKRYLVGSSIAPESNIQIPTSTTDTNRQCNGTGSVQPPEDTGRIGTKCTLGDKCPNGGGNGGPPAIDWHGYIWVSGTSRTPQSCTLYPDYTNNKGWKVTPSDIDKCYVNPNQTSIVANYGAQYPQITKSPITCHKYTAVIAFTFPGNPNPVYSNPITVKMPRGTQSPC